MWAIRLWYRVAAITMASSGVWHTNPWHSSSRGVLLERMTMANSGECSPEDSLRLSAALLEYGRQKGRGAFDKPRRVPFWGGSQRKTYLSGRKSARLSMFSGSVMSGRNAAPPSDEDTTNLTADQTAMFGKGVTSGSRPLAALTRSPIVLMSNVPAFWCCGKLRKIKKIVLELAHWMALHNVHGC